MNRWISFTAGSIIVIAIAVLLIVGPKAGSVDNLRSTLLNYGPWAAVAVSAGLMIAQAIIAPLPANAITITNSLVFGPIWGSLLSWFTTPRRIHEANHFHFHPILEVAAVFAGIFVTMVPTLHIFQMKAANKHGDWPSG